MTWLNKCNEVNWQQTTLYKKFEKKNCPSKQKYMHLGYKKADILFLHKSKRTWYYRVLNFLKST